ncbi:MAG TPA: poly(3-hydroxyalkanoate) depolymerase [Propionibacteriaceae bacterium]|nr:poly(3-hydroxyalkanoate) depolymerase [Propionibacteriaceae bacterium]
MPIPDVTGARTVTVRGHELRIWTRPGAPGRTPLVLCSGIGTGYALLLPFVEALDPDVPVIGFDAPGVGGSPIPRLPYRFPILASLIGALVRQLGYDRFDVLGISWGGGLAQQIAFQNPRRCRRVVLVATGTGSLMVPARPSVLLTMATPRRHRDPEYLMAVAPSIYGGQVRNHPDLVASLAHARSRGGVSRRGYAYQMLAGAGWTSLPLLPLLRQPVLILAGDDDPIIPLANAWLLNSLIPHSSLYVYHDGHLGLVTSASVLGPVVADFLGSAHGLLEED